MYRIMSISRMGIGFGCIIRTKTGTKERRKYAVFRCNECNQNFITMLREEFKILSCGCVRIEATAKRVRTHGRSTSNTYKIWNGIKQRCLNTQSKAYLTYGNRGITMCNEWTIFQNFLNDMGERPAGLSIERINNDLGYCKENCKWATSKEQASNKRTTRIIEIDGVSKSMKDWSREENARVYETIRARLKRGIPPKQAVFKYQ
jgi:hypothetical protein